MGNTSSIAYVFTYLPVGRGEGKYIYYYYCTKPCKQIKLNSFPSSHNALTPSSTSVPFLHRTKWGWVMCIGPPESTQTSLASLTSHSTETLQSVHKASCLDTRGPSITHKFHILTPISTLFGHHTKPNQSTWNMSTGSQDSANPTERPPFQDWLISSFSQGSECIHHRDINSCIKTIPYSVLFRINHTLFVVVQSLLKIYL